MKTEINITPLVDVVLVLLIIFMVVAPLLQKGKAVALPQATPHAHEKTSTPKPEPWVISIRQDKAIFFNEKQLSKKALAKEIQQQLSTQGLKEILLKGDKTLPFEEIRPLLEALQQTGFKHIALAVEERKGS
ncbi:MAG: biopolymer transporter ExbD [Cystobacterineae bacterium]|nr:biopolymer transporter ExbD [Cystobacterineae bacterium]